MKWNTKLLITSLTVFISTQTLSLAAEPHAHHNMHGAKTPLTEAGNDAFGTLQETLQKLLADPKTDWSKVNMEALRQHLVDMRNFTLNVDVTAQTPIKNGIEVTLIPDNKRVGESLDRVFSAHPASLKSETGWDMRTSKKNGQYKIIITGKSREDIQKIQGLGYIGVMVWGNHHQAHHWMMANGGNPH